MAWFMNIFWFLKIPKFLADSTGLLTEAEKHSEEKGRRTEQRILKFEHLSLLRSEMKPEIFNEGKFVQHGK